MHEGAVGLHAGCAADGGPVARGVVEETDVGVAVAGEVVGFARGGVGVEEEVDAAGFLVASCVSFFPNFSLFHRLNYV